MTHHRNTVARWDGSAWVEDEVPEVVHPGFDLSDPEARVALEWSKSVVDETSALRDLAQRAVRAPGWRWLPGMATHYDERVVDVGYDGKLLVGSEDGGVVWVRAADDEGPRTPDLADPATLGCLQALAGGRLYLERTSDGWRMTSLLEPRLRMTRRTQAEALIDVLEERS